MIPRDLAASIVPVLEETLDHLLKARALGEDLPQPPGVEQLIDELWLPTANTAGMLAVIGEAYPDLAGPDVAFREAKGARKSHVQLDVGLIRDELGQALELLNRAASMFALAQAVDPTARERFRSRFAESVTTLHSVRKRLP